MAEQTQAPAVAWRRGTPPESGWYLVSARNINGEPRTTEGRWLGSRWDRFGVYAWAPLPPPAPPAPVEQE